MKRERMRARGHRGTHGLVNMVREQVGLLVESTFRMATQMDALGRMVNALAETVDDHETRIVRLETRRKP